MSVSVPCRTPWWSSAWRYCLISLLSLAAFMIAVDPMISADPTPRSAWLFFGDVPLGIISIVLMRWRHRNPAIVTALVAAFSLVSATSSITLIWVVGSLASYRRWPLLAFAAPMSVIGTFTQGIVYAEPPGDRISWWVQIVVSSLIVGINAAIGYAMGSRREVLQSLRDRAETSEREQQQRLARAQADERTRIAREMHDVLAHRISLVALHAGAMSYRTDLSAEQRAIAAKTIEENAHQALLDLRSVLGVLRDPTAAPDAPPERPQPVLEDLAQLAADERAGGMRITLTNTVAGEVPMAVGRTAYRVVQEAVTNARKHAPHTTVSVTIHGSAADGVTVAIRNAAPVGAEPSPLPASGLGLIGLSERISLSGGTFEHGEDPDGGYAVRAWIPWTS